MAKEKLFNDALRVAVLMESREKGKTRLRLIADRLAQEAEDGNIAAIIAVSDRLDGKPAQRIEGSEDDGAHRVIHEIRRVIEDAVDYAVGSMGPAK